LLVGVGAIVDVVTDGAELVVCAPPPDEVVAAGILVVASTAEIALFTRLNSVPIQAVLVGKIVGFKAGQVIGLLWRNEISASNFGLRNAQRQ